MKPADLLARLGLPTQILSPLVLDRLEIVPLLLRAYELGTRSKEKTSRDLYLLPEQGEAMLDRLLLDLEWARERVIVVSFLPPDRQIGRALDTVRRRLGDRVQVILDGTTQAAVGRADLPWADVRVLPEGGTIHAKLLIVDGIAWWGSWNLSRSATRQADIVERVQDPAVLARLLLWGEEVRKISSPVDVTERPRGPHVGSAERVEVKTGDPDLGF